MVPVFPEHWKYEPFSAHKEDNGDIYGRGTQAQGTISWCHLFTSRHDPNGPVQYTIKGWILTFTYIKWDCNLILWRFSHQQATDSRSDQLSSCSRTDLVVQYGIILLSAVPTVPLPEPPVFKFRIRNVLGGTHWITDPDYLFGSLQKAKKKIFQNLLLFT